MAVPEPELDKISRRPAQLSTSPQLQPMAGTKKSKNKKSAAEAPTPVINDSDADLVDDLLEQLDSRDHVVQAESASIINSMHLDERAQIMESSHKQDAKSRFKARQVCRYLYGVPCNMKLC